MSATSDQRWVQRVLAEWDAAQADYRARWREDSVARGYPETYLDGDRPTAEQCLAAVSRARRGTTFANPVDAAALAARDKVEEARRLRVVISKTDRYLHPADRVERGEQFVTSYVGQFYLGAHPEGGWQLTDARTGDTAGPFPTKDAVVNHLDERTDSQHAADQAQAKVDAIRNEQVGRALAAHYDKDPDGFLDGLLRTPFGR